MKIDSNFLLTFFNFFTTEKGINVLNFVLLITLVIEQLGISSFKKRKKLIEMKICKNIFCNYLTRDDIVQLKYLLKEPPLKVISRKISVKVENYLFSIKDKKDYTFSNKKLQILKENFERDLASLHNLILKYRKLSIGGETRLALQRKLLYINNPNDEYSFLDYSVSIEEDEVIKAAEKVEESYMIFYTEARKLYYFGD